MDTRQSLRVQAWEVWKAISSFVERQSRKRSRLQKSLGHDTGRKVRVDEFGVCSSFKAI